MPYPLKGIQEKAKLAAQAGRLCSAGFYLRRDFQAAWDAAWREEHDRLVSTGTLSLDAMDAELTKQGPNMIRYTYLVTIVGDVRTGEDYPFTANNVRQELMNNLEGIWTHATTDVLLVPAQHQQRVHGVVLTAIDVGE